MSDNEESFAELSMSDDEEMFTSVIEPKSLPVEFTLGEEEESSGESTVSQAEVETVADAPVEVEEECVEADESSVADETATEVAEEEPLTLYEEAANNQMLLLGGADSNALDGAGLTPLYYTVQHNHVELARALLLAGAKPTRDSRKSASALDAARGSPHTYLFQLLESAVEKQESELRIESPPCIMISA